MDTLFTLFITDRNGGELGFEDFDSLDELFARWPDAEREDASTYTAWIGSRR